MFSFYTTACYNVGMSFESIVGHDLVKEVLRLAIERPAPGYVFFGPDGVGKRGLAEAFIRGVLAHPEPLPLVAHPDFLALTSATGTSMKVEEVRQFVEQLHQTSARGGRRVALILEADQLTEAAANALLKDVEESRKVVYVFVTDQFSALPATLRSRLVPIACQVVPREMMDAWLKEKGLDDKARQETLEIAQGSPGRAVRFLEDRQGSLRWLNLADEWLQSMQRDRLGQQLAVIDRIAKTCEAQGDTAKSWGLFLSAAMTVMRGSFASTPEVAWRWSQALLLGWSLAGTSVSPRVGLEWACVSPYTEGEMPSLLIPSFV